MAGTLRLLLTRSAVQQVNFQYLGAYRLRVDVSDPSSSGADPFVFLYRRGTPNPYDATVEDKFLAVASPADLAQYPRGEPDPAAPYPIFRLDFVELDLRSTALAERLWVEVVRQVNTLLEACERLAALVPVAEIWVGAAPPTPPGPPGPSSASLSSSQSSSQSAGP